MVFWLPRLTSGPRNFYGYGCVEHMENDKLWNGVVRPTRVSISPGSNLPQQWQRARSPPQTNNASSTVSVEVTSWKHPSFDL